MNESERRTNQRTKQRWRQIVVIIQVKPTNRQLFKFLNVNKWPISRKLNYDLEFRIWILNKPKTNPENNHK